MVCSARSGDSKSTGTTNLLLRAASEALRPRPDLTPSTSTLPPTPNGSGTPTVLTPSEGANQRIAPLSSQLFQRTRTSSNGNVNVNGNGGGSRSGFSTPYRTRGGGDSLSASLSSLTMRSSLEDNVLATFNATVDQIKEDHLSAARKVIRDEEILGDLEDDLEYDCERLRSFLLAAQVRFFLFPFWGVGHEEGKLTCCLASRLLMKSRRGQRILLWELERGYRVGL